jgi:hypothetical protein
MAAKIMHLNNKNMRQNRIDVDTSQIPTRSFTHLWRDA